MNENAGRFRSAAFGGFHRQDVLDYIQTLTQESQNAIKESQDTIKTLTSQLEESQAERKRLEQELQTLKSQHRQAEETCRTLEEELTRCKSEVEQQWEVLSEAETQAQELRSRVAELEPGAASWQHIKSTAGDIEVSAHERAQITIQEAQSQAAEIHAEGVRWVLEIQARCDKLQRELNNSFRATENELNTIRRAYTRTAEDMEGFQKALSELVASLEPGTGEE